METEEAKRLQHDLDTPLYNKTRHLLAMFRTEMRQIVLYSRCRLKSKFRYFNSTISL